MRGLTVSRAAQARWLAACKKKAPTDGTGTASGSAPASASGTATAGSAAGTGSASGAAVADPGSGSASGATELAMANKAGNCPSAVVGATTAIVEDKDAVGKLAMTITAKEPAAVETIRKRVAHLVEVQAAPDAEIKHTGDGTGGAATGMCPVITSKDAKITASDVEGGSKVVIEPSGALTLDALKTDVAARIAKTGEWATANIKPTADSGGGGGVGGGKGDHGGNHSGDGDGQGKKDGSGGGKGTGGGGSKGTGGGGGSGDTPANPDKGS